MTTAVFLTPSLELNSIGKLDNDEPVNTERSISKVPNSGKGCMGKIKMYCMGKIRMYCMGKMGG